MTWPALEAMERKDDQRESQNLYVVGASLEETTLSVNTEEGWQMSPPPFCNIIRSDL